MIGRDWRQCPYFRNGTITTFNSEIGEVEFGCWCYSTGLVCNEGNYTTCGVAGFKNEDETSFFLDSIGDKILNYPDNDLSTDDNDTYLFYDGHPGYDYPEEERELIHAPAGGTLCVATSVTEKPIAGLWRNTEECSLATVGGTDWDGYHTFYIIHRNMYINGSVDDYMTVFLHSNNLESSIETEIEEFGCAKVERNECIAGVGGYPNYSNHLHLEVYKWNKADSEWKRVDPYGNGVGNVLWEQQP